MGSKRKFIALDIETAKIVPGESFNWQAHRPLGITCIATFTGDGQPRAWYSTGEDGVPSAQMSRDDVREVVLYLNHELDQGALPLSWNGLAFDFDILAEESDMWGECRQLAHQHVDMMYHVVCQMGHPVALKNAAKGMNLAGKLAGVEGIDAPALWKAGQFDTVLKYVAQDVRVTLAVAEEAERRKRFEWLTTAGKIKSMPLPDGWLSVADAERLPLPDTSWMSQPLKRERFTAWLRSKSREQHVSQS